MKADAVRVALGCAYSSKPVAKPVALRCATAGCGKGVTSTSSDFLAVWFDHVTGTA